MNQPDDQDGPQFDPSGLELDLPPPPSGPVKSTPSTPGARAMRSAQRDQPLAPEAPKKLDKAALKEGAVDTLLNSVSILSEIAEDFRTSDRFFKYKAAVLVGWLMLSFTSVGVACADRGPSNDINATLVQAGDASQPVYLVKNESMEVWHDVEVLVNGQYRATLATMDRNGGSIALSPAVLFDEGGKKAPSNLVITDIVVTVSEPDESVTLLRGGQIVK
ncbi:MAG: hypothetical protein JNJ54_00260 [Myxococcaceae bacterium]|nr:hypothetical protein [Myxococcaceae bacterium]